MYMQCSLSIVLINKFISLQDPCGSYRSSPVHELLFSFPFTSARVVIIFSDAKIICEFK